jgi:hypothetical protein
MGLDVVAVHSQYGRMVTERANWEEDWDYVVQFIRPRGLNFQTTVTAGDSRTADIYDSTPLWALNQFAAGLHTFNTSPTDRWFSLTVDGIDVSEDEEALKWLEDASDAIYKEYGKPDVGFNQTINEIYLELGSFGTGVLFQDWDVKGNKIVFRAYPLAQCYIGENFDGEVDTVYRCEERTVRQLMQRFGEKNMPKKVMEMKGHEKLKLIHAVFPRTDREMGKLDAGNKKYASVWYLPDLVTGQPDSDSNPVLKESGYSEFPYHVPRWTKLAGELYGRGPAQIAIHDVRLLNTMSKTTVENAEKIVSPPMVAIDDSIMGDLDTSSDGITWVEQGSQIPQKLDIGGDVGLGLEMEEQRRGAISRSFFLDAFLRGKKNERQTAFEINDERNQMLQQMSPMLSRLQMELFGPMIDRTFALMVAGKKIPPAPESIQGANTGISYTSPANRAQKAVKVGVARQFLQDVALVAQFDPSVAKSVNGVELLREIAIASEVTRSAIKDPEQVKQEEQAEAAQQQQMQASESAATTAGALKDLSQAGVV